MPYQLEFSVSLFIYLQKHNICTIAHVRQALVQYRKIKYKSCSEIIIVPLKSNNININKCIH